MSSTYIFDETSDDEEAEQLTSFFDRYLRQHIPFTRYTSIKQFVEEEQQIEDDFQEGRPKRRVKKVSTLISETSTKVRNEALRTQWELFRILFVLQNSLS